MKNLGFYYDFMKNYSLNFMLSCLTFPSDKLYLETQINVCHLEVIIPVYQLSNATLF